MGANGRPSFTKRQKEQTRLERQRDKAAKRQQRKVDRQNGVVRSPEDDAAAPAEAGASTDEPAAPELAPRSAAAQG
jgi:hypothetical protein